MSYWPKRGRHAKTTFGGLSRSKLMSRVHSRGNRVTEIILAQLLRRNRIVGWRRHQPIFGVPDFIFRKHHLVLFVDGCFWHGCPKHKTKPKNNSVHWLEKFARNKRRDRLVTRTLRSQGWRVLRIWEHELSRKNESRLLRRIQKALK